DVRQEVLPNRVLELRLVDLHPRRLELVQQRERVADRVAPALVTQLHGDRILAERTQQPRERLARRGRVFERRRELREQRAEFAGVRERRDAAPKFVEVGGVDVDERGDRVRRTGRIVWQSLDDAI